MNNINDKFRAGLAVAAGLVALCACTDTWNDHYDTAPQLKFNGSAMQALEELTPDFAKVVRAYGFDKELSSDNTYTVWAPADGTFALSDYISASGERVQDSAEVVNEFIKNHVARYAWTLNATDQTFSLLNEKVGKMTADGKFGEAVIDAASDKRNLACTNGILYVIDSPNPYETNLLEKIRDLYRLDSSEGKEECSLYAFLYDPRNNADTLIESKSVNRGVDENGEKIWVYRYMEPNNTPLKNMDARLYEEDSSFIAIIPTARAWTERYKEAEKLLAFNPSLDKQGEGVCDSLTRYYANMFTMTDLFYNKRANEHAQDSLKSTNYRLYGSPWYENVYYSTMPKNLPEDKELNDILAKCGEGMECSNGTAYSVDEFPMSIYEQFFKKIKVTVSDGNVNKLTDASGRAMKYTTNLPSTFYRTWGQFVSWVRHGDEDASSDEDAESAEEAEGTEEELDEDEIPDGVSVDTKRTNFSYVTCTPSAAGNIQLGVNVNNTLSGTYDLFLVTSPIWMKNHSNGQRVSEMNLQGYKFSVTIVERLNDDDTADSDQWGLFPDQVTNDMKMVNPTPTVAGNPNIYETPYGRLFGEDGHPVVNDTTYLGEWTFKNAYYGRNDYGVVVLINSQVEFDDMTNYSREMLIGTLILKPHDPSKPVIEQPADEARRRTAALPARKNYKLITSNTHN